MNRKTAAWLAAVTSAIRVRAVLSAAAPFHFGDRILAEESGLRQAWLKAYARFEVQLLAILYRILNLPVMRGRRARFLMYWLGGAKLLGERGIVSTVKTLGEMEEFIRSLPEDSLMAVGPCRCRLATHACDHPLETDIVIMTGAPLWLDLFPDDYRVIDREEAASIVRECYAQGLVPMLDRHLYFRESANYFVICNCCGCACLPIIAYRTFKHQGLHFIPSASVAVIDSDKCVGCGKCVEVCAFGERVVRAGRARILDCQGCGQCVRVCPNGANVMVKRGAEAGRPPVVTGQDSDTVSS